MPLKITDRKHRTIDYIVTSTVNTMITTSQVTLQVRTTDNALGSDSQTPWQTMIQVQNGSVQTQKDNVKQTVT